MYYTYNYMYYVYCYSDIYSGNPLRHTDPNSGDHSCGGVPSGVVLSEEQGRVQCLFLPLQACPQSGLKYHASGNYDDKNEYIDSGVSSPVTTTSPVPVKPRPPVPQARPAPAGPGRKPPPRPPNKPAQA